MLSCVFVSVFCVGVCVCVCVRVACLWPLEAPLDELSLLSKPGTANANRQKEQLEDERFY